MPSAAAELAVPETEELKRKIGNITGRMATLLESSIQVKKKSLESLAASRVMRNPIYILDEKKTRLLMESTRFESATKLLLSDKRAIFEKTASKLEALNPLSVLLRGYSAVFHEDGTLLKSTKDVAVGDTVVMRTSDGKIQATVTEIEQVTKPNI